jgi:protein-L-isoaspartate(D-aspartate) O-methyltransferase
MIQALKLTPLDKVLEVGTGSGYATALLGKMAAEVITVDIDAEQQARAKTVLDNLGYKNITYQVADGLAAEIGGGLFDAIYIGGATNNIPEQLKISSMKKAAIWWWW